MGGLEFVITCAAIGVAIGSWIASWDEPSASTKAHARRQAAADVEREYGPQRRAAQADLAALQAKLHEGKD
jgi:hypothetical protein